jgi:hypothetical protein
MRISRPKERFMAKHFILRGVAALLVAALFLQGCGSTATPTASPAPSPSDSATAAATATASSTPPATFTPRPTVARSSTPVATRTPTRVCGDIVDGWWGSKEVVETYWTTTPFPMVQFHVEDCQVCEFILVVYPSSGQLFEGDLVTPSGAIRDGSVSVSFDNPAGAGALSIYGGFPTGISFQGYLMFSRGFQIHDFFLPDTVTIPFRAELALRDT